MFNNFEMYSGTQPNLRDHHQGITGLVRAAATGLADVVELLLQSGANGNHFDHLDRGLVYFGKHGLEWPCTTNDPIRGGFYGQGWESFGGQGAYNAGPAGWARR